MLVKENISSCCCRNHGFEVCSLSAAHKAPAASTCKRPREMPVIAIVSTSLYIRMTALYLMCERIFKVLHV